MNNNDNQTIKLERDRSLYIKSDTQKGRGVFAGGDIKQSSIVETCPVLVLDPIENIKHIEKTSMYHYTFNWPTRDASGNTVQTQAVVFGLGSMFNHSRAHQNVGWKRDIDREAITYYALRDIAPDEELCISYGDHLTFEDVDEQVESGVQETAEEHLNKIDLT